MAKKKKSTFFNTPWNERGGLEKNIIVVGTVVGAFLVYTRGKKFLAWLKGLQAGININQDLAAQPNKPSYQNSQYFIFADTLYSAMQSDWYNPFDYGTDEEGVQSVMDKMKNDSDVLKLVQAFGKRDGYTLQQWIAEDFSAEDKQIYVNGPLANKGIKYRF